MTIEYRTTVRRRDRAVHDDTWIRTTLQRAGSGVFATVVSGQPYLNSNLFVFDDGHHAIYLHTAAQGRTAAAVEGSDRVCFTVFELGRLLPADVALEFSCEYASVVVFGTGHVVQDVVEQRHALQLLLDKYFPDKRPGRDYRAITDRELVRTAVFRISIEDWVGKRKRAEPDFPDARRYSAPSLLELEAQ